eukprot:TRINITY_DN70715_c0_g1_i1.p1 TRINITY_DN70715_c0_g1~~TRINITY_DN70715_c0_g1_i1.p1  ORF type:complete len:170 (+),score=6.76 TRINITY_DN70715_c0_g1_i1:161-670(+)
MPSNCGSDGPAVTWMPAGRQIGLRGSTASNNWCRVSVGLQVGGVCMPSKVTAGTRNMIEDANPGAIAIVRYIPRSPGGGSLSQMATVSRHSLSESASAPMLPHGKLRNSDDAASRPTSRASSHSLRTRGSRSTIAATAHRSYDSLSRPQPAGLVSGFEGCFGPRVPIDR